MCPNFRLQLRHEPEVRQTELEIGRTREKIRDVTERLQELASESQNRSKIDLKKMFFDVELLNEWVCGFVNSDFIELFMY